MDDPEEEKRRWQKTEEEREQRERQQQQHQGVSPLGATLILSRNSNEPLLIVPQSSSSSSSPSRHWVQHDPPDIEKDTTAVKWENACNQYVGSAIKTASDFAEFLHECGLKGELHEKGDENPAMEQQQYRDDLIKGLQASIELARRKFDDPREECLVKALLANAMNGRGCMAAQITAINTATMNVESILAGYKSTKLELLPQLLLSELVLERCGEGLRNCLVKLQTKFDAKTYQLCDWYTSRATLALLAIETFEQVALFDFSENPLCFHTYRDIYDMVKHCMSLKDRAFWDELLPLRIAIQNMTGYWCTVVPGLKINGNYTLPSQIERLIEQIEELQDLEKKREQMEQPAQIEGLLTDLGSRGFIIPNTFWTMRDYASLVDTELRNRNGAVYRIVKVVTLADDPNEPKSLRSRSIFHLQR